MVSGPETRHGTAAVTFRISSTALILTGIAAIPAFLFQNSLLFQIVQVSTFFIAAALSGKKIRILPPLIMLVSITLLNLFTPIGRVLVSFRRISVTAGALRLGIHKALTLIGLIYLSRAAVRSDLSLPGRFGSIITRTFYYFDQVNETWRTIPKQPVIKRLDALLFHIYADRPETRGQTAGEKRTTSLPGYCLLFLFLTVQWGLFSLQFFVSWDVLSTA
jgi:hypothetical protein